MIVRDQDAWTTESTAIVRRINLQTGETLQIYRGHSAPVTCLAFYTVERGGKTSELLITGSWDKTIRIWDTETKECVSTTDAHDDFLKSICVIPSLRLVASGASDKSIRMWDLSVLSSSPASQLLHVGTFTGHTRPVECLSVDGAPRFAAEEEYATITENLRLYSADSMGVIKIWSLDISTRASGALSIRGNVVRENKAHRTGINDMVVSNGQIWTGSTDYSVIIQGNCSTDDEPSPTVEVMSPKTITHPSLVRAVLPLPLVHVDEPYLISGSADKIFVWDITSVNQKHGVIEKVVELDAHSHDVTAIEFWEQAPKGKSGISEIWIVTAGLDCMVRRWRLKDILNGTYQRQVDAALKLDKSRRTPPSATITEEEERELEELMSSDD
ncbi:WD40-repeat-containing domain protein [Cantharellus anzutake]|nr:WD40-repeat-containing domain protein [Cantharellus anzutake]KAF8312050.1 WD40-repeat-containing domain protein [Cantharellus anzutake]